MPAHQTATPAARPLSRATAVTSRTAAVIAIAAGTCLGGLAHAAGVCEARSGASAPTVVELYTSEGCSSCPPADKWLSTLKRDDVVALAFHVTYWDRLGWTDRFAQPAFTERQRLLMAPSGARYVYTPQVVVNGKDAPNWSLPKAVEPAPLDLELTRDGDVVTARINRRAGAPGGGNPRQLTGYWALLEDGHRSDVRAGENAGEKLRHDHVVSQYQPVAAWSAEREQRLQWQLPRAAQATGGVQRQVAFVVVNPETQRPVQALTLGC